MTGRWLSIEFASIYSPPAVWLNVFLAIAWAAMQVVGIAAAVAASDRNYTRCICAIVLAGPAIMAFDRFGPTLMSVRACVPVILPAIMLLPAIHICGGGFQISQARRLMLLLIAVGIAHLFSCSPEDGLAQVQSLAITTFVLVAFSRFPSARHLLRKVDALAPIAVCNFLWRASGILLICNSLSMWLTDSPTPQISVHSLTFAPYWLASLTILTATGLELLSGSTKRLVIGLAVMMALYVLGLHEGGTAGVVLIGSLLIVVILGNGRAVFTGLLAGLFGYSFLKSSVGTKLIGLVSSRMATRLAEWNGHALNPQLTNYFAVLRSSGIIGWAGRARVPFLVGSQTSQDFILAAIAANSGVVGFIVVAVGIIFYVAELARMAVGERTPWRQAAGVAIVIGVIANALVTYLPISGGWMPTGLPVPLVSRGVSHTIIAAAVLVLLETLVESREEMES